MPIDYKKYPPNWLTEIRPRILKRAGGRCEFPGCDFKEGEWVWAVKHHGRTKWFRSLDEAMKQPMTFERKNGKDVPNPKQVKVVLTIAHLDNDETNWDVKDDRLRAACQLCHLRYDAAEKYRRAMSKSKSVLDSYR